jgi:hypothetical protein
VYVGVSEMMRRQDSGSGTGAEVKKPARGSGHDEKEIFFFPTV